MVLVHALEDLRQHFLLLGSTLARLIVIMLILGSYQDTWCQLVLLLQLLVRLELNDVWQAFAFEFADELLAIF